MSTPKGSAIFYGLSVKQAVEIGRGRLQGGDLGFDLGRSAIGKPGDIVLVHRDNTVAGHATVQQP